MKTFPGLGILFVCCLAACGGEGTLIGGDVSPAPAPRPSPEYQPPLVETHCPGRKGPFTYVAMGTTGLVANTTELPGLATEPVEVIAVEGFVRSDNGISAAPIAVRDVRLAVAGVVESESVNLDPASTSFTQTVSWSNFGSFPKIPQNGTLKVDHLLNVNTWQNLQPSGWETDQRQITFTVGINNVTYRGLTTGTVVTLRFVTSTGTIFRIFRGTVATVTSTPANEVEGGYSSVALAPHVVTGDYTICSDGEVGLNTAQINWFVDGVAPTAKDLSWVVYGSNQLSLGTLGEVVASGSSTITGSGSSYYGSFVALLPPPIGLALKDQVPLKLAIVFNTQGSFTKTGEVGPISLRTELIGCTSNDGTSGLSTPVACDPALFIAPVVGHVVTSN